MSSSTNDKVPPTTDASSGAACPAWCFTRHGVQMGEEDWVHGGEPLTVTEDVVARLCMSTDPATGVIDGPYVIVGSTQYTPDEAEALAQSLMAMAHAARGVMSP